MKEIIRNLRVVLGLFIAIAACLLGGLVYQQDRSRYDLNAVGGEDKKALSEMYGLQAGDIETRDGFVIAQSMDGERAYPDAPYSDAYIHLVGDYTHHIANTIEANYQSTLLGQERNLFEQLMLDASGKGFHGDQLTLTLDHRISQVVADQFRTTGYKGAAVVMNWQTGDVLAAVSFPAPTYDQLIHYEDLEDGALVNRVLSGEYAPGSTFKIFTSAAWLEYPEFDPDFIVHCEGQSLVPNGPGNYGGTAHGSLHLIDAFYESCNVFFGALGDEMGKDWLLQKLSDYAFTEPIRLDRLAVRRQRASIDVDDRGTTAWFSIGQPIANSELVINPLTHTTYAAAIANGGLRLEPHVIYQVRNPLGQVLENRQVSEWGQVFSPQTASDLQKLMEYNADMSGLSFSGLRFGLKTGTAEVDGQEGNTSLLSTYLREDDYPYAMVMIFENSPGSYAMIPYAQNIYRRLIEVAP